MIPQHRPDAIDRRLTDKAADQSSREHRALIRALYDSPLLAGRLVEVDFDASATSYAVQHGLGRRPQGYIVTKANAAMIVYDGEVGTGDRKEVVWLQSSASGTATLWIF
jgi:hypothetical protein